MTLVNINLSSSNRVLVQFGFIDVDIASMWSTMSELIIVVSISVLHVSAVNPVIQ